MIGKRATIRRRNTNVWVAIVTGAEGTYQSLIGRRWGIRKNVRRFHWRNSQKNTPTMAVCQAPHNCQLPQRATRPLRGPQSPREPSWPTLINRHLLLPPLLRCCAFLGPVPHPNYLMNKGTCISVLLWLFAKHEAPSNFCAGWLRPSHFWRK